MIRVSFRFYGELNDLLNPLKRQRRYSTYVTIRSSIKDAIESQRVPHPEVALLFLNDNAVGWKELLHKEDRISAFPRSYNLPIPEEDTLIKAFPNPPAFLLDVHLGKLAKSLRLLGFDTVYYSIDRGDEALVKQAVKEERILLTFDHQMLMRNGIDYGRIVRNRDPKKQIIEVLDRFELREKHKAFTRCLNCNGLLVMPQDQSFLKHVPECVLKRLGPNVNRFRICSNCQQLFWQGTHTDEMLKNMKKWGIEYNQRVWN